MANSIIVNNFSSLIFSGWIVSYTPTFIAVTFQMAISLDEEVELSPYPTQNHSGISLSPESFVLL